MAHKVKKIILSSLIVSNQLSTITPLYVRATASDNTQENTDSILEQESNIQETVDSISEKSLNTRAFTEGVANTKVSQIAKSKYFAQYNQVYKIDSASISTSNNGWHYPNSFLSNMFDGKKSTYWETNTYNTPNFKNELIFTFEKVEEISRIILTPRQDVGAKGFPLKYEIYGTLDENSEEYKLIAQGSYSQATTADMEIEFPKTRFKKLKFRFVEAYRNWAAIAEIGFYYEDTVSDAIPTIFKDKLYTELSAEFDTKDKIEAFEQQLKSHPLRADYESLVNLAKDVVYNLSVVKSEIITLSQLGNPDTERNLRHQSYPFDNLDTTGYYIKPGKKAKFYIFCDKQGLTSPVQLAVRQTGVTDNNTYTSLNQTFYTLNEGLNIIEIDTTSKKYGVSLYLKNNSKNPVQVRISEYVTSTETESVTEKALNKYPTYTYNENEPEKFYTFLQEINTYVHDRLTDTSIQDMADIEIGK